MGLDSNLERNGTIEYRIPDRSETVRSPGDALRFVVAFIVSSLGVAAVIVADQGAHIWDQGVMEFLAQIESRPIDRIGVAVVQITAVALPIIVFILVWLAVRGWRPLLIGVGMAVGAFAVWLLEQIVGRAVPTVFLEVLGSELWIAPAAFPGAPYFAGLAASLVVAGPMMSRRWRRASWMLIWAMVLFRLWSLTALLFDMVVAVSVGWMVGAAILYIFGAPNRSPRAWEVAEALRRAGIEPVRIEAAFVDARASSPYFVGGFDGHRYFIKVLSQDDRSADLLFRAYRWIRTKNIGDERAFSSLRRGVEHEALVAYSALDAGVSTPAIRAVADVGGSAMLLAYDAVDLRTLAEVDADDLARRHLASIWSQIVVLHGSRTAHRDLRLANLAIDDADRPVIIDFGFSELSADDSLLSADVAELVLSSSTVVGARRAVAIAAESIGVEAVVRAGPLMQPLAVSGATRTALKGAAGLLEEVHNEVRGLGGLEVIEFEPIERVRPRTLAMLVAIGVAFYLLLPRLAEVDLTTISRANLAWAGLALLLTVGKYVGNALAVHGSVPMRLPPGGPFLAELASTFANRISPAKLGGLGVNMRYLQKSGVQGEIALAGVALIALISAVVHLATLVVFAVWVGRADLAKVELPSGEAVLVGLVVVLAIAGVIVRVPRVRHMWTDRLYPAIRKSASGLAEVASSPARMMLVFGGSLLAVLAYVGALFASIEAFGGGLPFAAVGVVYLAGSAIGGLAPIPGGIGAVEAALIAALTAFGLDASIAVPGVFLFRIVSFWIPILPGWAAMAYMDRTGSL